ncbi:MAG TPA: NAD(P)H-dependent glycerol-3-phosphate dehydrogenase [Candidatus Acidoferrales bacterium]|jgi:glycerol-3-phosphate dehydrogenase (NAD(P)+)|nr:NAD(P)H-dependent glycerol-3-phosphate dehydrogenase [Candidatus Acidoferrales bacterium]
MKKIAIIGGGSWGTALAIVLSRSRHEHSLALWVHDSELGARLRQTRENSIYLPGYSLPPGIEVSSDLAVALHGAEIVLGVIPSAHARDVYSAMVPHLRPGVAIVSATKGLEPGALLRMSEVIAAVCAAAVGSRIAVLSGPSFAREAARGDPTAIAIASHEPGLAAELQEEFGSATFRLYTNDDVAGVELAGAVKNVIAIAAGVCAGLGLGGNSAAALVTRGLAEMTRLATALGGRRDTLAGLAGMGDLVLTSTGALSRNRSLGVELGKGRALDEILSTSRMIAEGVGTTAATRELARRAGIEMPITDQMYAVLYERRAPRDAIRELMERRQKSE